MADEPLENGYPARIVRLEEWRKSVDRRLDQVPSAAQVAVLGTNMTAMNNEITRQGKAFDQFVEDWNNDKAKERDRQSSRNLAVWGWVVALICCLIGASTLVLVSVGHL